MKKWVIIGIVIGIIVVVIIGVFIFRFGSDKGRVMVLGGGEFQIQEAEYEAGKIIITLNTNVSVENARIDVIDEADQLLCTGYKDLIAGITQIEMSDCKAKEKITVSVSPPGGGIITRRFTLDVPIPRVEIVGAEYGLRAELALSLNANIEIKNTRIEVFDESGSVLCTKYIDLLEGLNEIKLKGCGARDKISVSVTPPEGVMTTADFTLELPLLEAKGGLNYQYKAVSAEGSIITDVFITTETSSEWQGVIGTKIDPDREAYIIQFKLKKADLDLLVTYPLAKEKVLSKDVEYVSTEELMESVMTWPFILAAFKPFGFDIDNFIEEGSFTFTQSTGPRGTLTLEEEKIYLNWLAYHLTLTDPPSGKELTFYVSVAKPYMLITLDIPEGMGPDKMLFTLEKVEERDFDLSYYNGYSIKE